jgi:hypothetical protein
MKPTSCPSPRVLARHARRAAGVLAAAGALVLLQGATASADGVFQTETAVNLRSCTYVDSCAVEDTIPKGASITISCWWPGTSVNGDSVWYETHWNGWLGYVSGYYVTTGHDPNPSIPQCSQHP